MSIESYRRSGHPALTQTMRESDAFSALGRERALRV
jgi:hypothetical protein